MMAPSCRYLPTCSEYSIQSYKRFGRAPVSGRWLAVGPNNTTWSQVYCTTGVWKGTVLTAWRLMRCNPLGSSGYDPPQVLAGCSVALADNI
jgi:hypothetical protein